VSYAVITVIAATATFVAGFLLGRSVERPPKEAP
jgi:hypothetical protein